MIDQPTKDFILSIAYALTGVCDGAHTKDCVGYNKMDAGKARRLVEEINHETDEMKLEQLLNDLRFTLIKYKDQIIRMGFDYDKMAKLHFVVNQIIIKDDEIRIYTTYNPDFIKELKDRAKTCYWNKSLRVWICKVIEGKVVSAIVQRYYPDAVIPTIPEPSIISRPKGRISVLSNYQVELATIYDQQLVEDIKRFPKRHYDPLTKKWGIYLNEKQDVDDLFALAKKHILEMTPEVVAFLQSKSQELSIKELSLEASASTDAQIVIPNLKSGLELFPFQKAGVKFIELHDGRALIADEMGLGKSIESLAYLQLHPEKRPAIVVCPASLKENWKRETEKWLNPNPKVQLIKSGMPITKGNDVYIINYDIVGKNLDTLKLLQPSVLILDECHYIKNFKAGRTKAVMDLAEGAKVPHIIALSGTPLLNRPIEIFTTIRLIRPDIFRSFKYFASRYANAHPTRWGMDYSGAANLPELQKILRENVMIRRLKKDVLKELPEKQRNFVSLDPSPEEWKDYMYASINLRDWLMQKTGGNIGAVMKSMKAEFLVKISELRQLIARAKLKSVEEWIDNFLEATDEKLVVFAVHKDIVERILANPKYDGIAFGFTGDEPPEYRQRIIDIFTNTAKYPRVRLFVATIATAGVGYNLQVANNVAMVELPWRPADLQQAEDRVHRIGQRNQVTIYYLLCANSIEENLAETLNTKLRVSSLALDTDAEESVMKGLIQMIIGSADSTDYSGDI